MEVDKFIGSIEKYVREFILYLLSFFWVSKSDGDTDPILESINKTFIFAILSAAAGAYLWNRYIYGNAGGVSDLAGLLTDTLLRWFAYGLFLYGLMLAGGMRPHVLLPILAVFKVFSVAHVVAIFASYITKNSLWMFSPNDEYLKFGASKAAQTAYILQAFLMFIYMPREIFSIATARARRLVTIVIVAVFLLTAGLISWANYLDPLAGIESVKTIAGVAKQPKGVSK